MHIAETFLPNPLEAQSTTAKEAECELEAFLPRSPRYLLRPLLPDPKQLLTTPGRGKGTLPP